MEGPNSPARFGTLIGPVAGSQSSDRRIEFSNESEAPDEASHQPSLAVHAATWRGAHSFISAGQESLFTPPVVLIGNMPNAPTGRPCRSARPVRWSDDYVGLAQRLNLRWGKTPARQRGLGVLPGSARRTAYRRRRPTQARRGGRLGDASYIDEGPALFQVRVLGRLAKGEDGSEADVAPLHDCAPLVPTLGLENRPQAFLEHGPLVRVHLAGKALAGEVGAVQELEVEARLDGPDGDVLPVLRLVDFVEGRARIEKVGASLVGPGACRAHPM